uniref:TIR domain-containing protein n=1 Tax=Yoonia sp. TaxID=2212373 RepID=UPI0040478DF6
MKIEEARDLLQNNGFQISEEKDLNSGQGISFRCKEGQILNAYHSGKIVVQGKNSEHLKALAGGPQPAAPAIQGSNRGVFAVYGHDDPAKTKLEAMLRRWGLQPQILDQLTSGGQTIIEKLESAIADVAFAVVLATPDDEGHRANHSEEKAHRARQNVVLELGMMLTKLGRDRVAILMKDQEKMERPSDIQGLLYIPFKDDVSEAALPLAKEIHSRGIPIDLSKV